MRRRIFDRRRRPRRRRAWRAAALWVAILAPVLFVSGLHLEVTARVAGLLDPARGCAFVAVVDGDTVRAHCPGEGIARVRLVGFDTPEVWSPGCLRELVAGTRATWALRWKVLRAGKIRFDFGGRDRYGRRLAAMFLDGADVARSMIAEGNALPYRGGRRPDWCDVLAE